MNLRSNFLIRITLFLCGLILISVPAFLIMQTLKESESLDLENRIREAKDCNDSVLSFFRNQDSFQIILDQKLSDASAKISRVCTFDSEYRTKTWDLQKALASFRKELLSDGLFVEQALLCHADRTATGTYYAHKTLKTHDYPESVQETLHLLSAKLCESFFRSITNNEKDFLYEKIVSDLSCPNDFGYFLDEFREKTLQIKIGDDAKYLFWAPIFHPKYRQMMEKETPKYEINSGMSEETYKKLTLKYFIGTVLLVLPRTMDRKSQLELLLNINSTPNTHVAIFSQDEKHPKFSRNCPEELRDRFTSGNPAQKLWEISSEIIETDSKKTIYAATRLKNMSTEMRRRHRFIALGTYLSILIGISVLFCSIFFEIALGSSIFGQLWFCFIFAALLPLAVSFFTIQQLIDERLSLKLQQNRLQILQEVEFIENRYLFHRPLLWAKIRELSRNARLFQCLRLLKKLPRRKDAIMAWLDRYMENACAYMDKSPNHLSTRRLIIAGTNGFYRTTASRVLDKKEDSFPAIVRELSDTIIKELNPAIAEIGHNDKKQSSRIKGNELVREIAFSNLQAIFGPHGYLQILYGQNKPFCFVAGHGDWFIHNYLIPDDSNPEFMISWMYLAKYSDREALRRIIAASEGRFRFFSFEPERMGHWVIPHNAPDIPALRAAARRISASKERASLRIEIDGETYQIEGSPLNRTNQFILIGIGSEKPIREGIYNLRLALSLPLIGVLALVFLLSWFASWEISSPLIVLRIGMHAVDSGDFTHRIEVDRDDELGDLCNAFNEMAHGLEEAELMKRMVSSAARKALDSDHEEASARSGETIDATIIFIGIPNFDCILQTCEPEEVIERMNVQTSVLCRIIDDHGGDIDKLIGDKTLSYFSHRDYKPEAAVRLAITAANELIDACERRVLPFTVAIGINSGTIIKGLLGSEKIRDYTIIGDPVNLAARAESVAETLTGKKIVVTENSSRLVKDEFAFTALKVTKVKGKQKEVMLAQLA